jgi:hypothetical protein
MIRSANIVFSTEEKESTANMAVNALYAVVNPKSWMQWKTGVLRERKAGTDGGLTPSKQKQLPRNRLSPKPGH